MEQPKFEGVFTGVRVNFERVWKGGGRRDHLLHSTRMLELSYQNDSDHDSIPSLVPQLGALDSTA